MERVSTNLMNDNMQYYNGKRQVEMDQANSRMASQNRILNLRDDPAAASHATRYESTITRLTRYSDNIQTALNVYKTTEDHVNEGINVLQRARELAVQGASGTYSKTDLQAMGREVDELLNHMIQIGNSVDGDGSALFAGQRTRNVPFRAVEGTVPGGDRSMVVDVQYTGDIGQRETEIADSQYVQLNIPGNQMFWAENQSVAAARDGRTFVATSDAQLKIDGQEVNVRAGDSLYAVVAKINDSKAAVKAHIDPVTSGLVIETTTPHQLWLQDTKGSVLKDLGILGDQEQPAGANLARDAQKSGGSAFDMLINMRNQLLAGNQLDVGGGALGGLDSALDNMLGHVGSIGARSERMDFAYRRTERLLPDMNARLSQETDIDMTKAITDMKVLELAHEAALSATARITKTSLLDFLR